MAFTETFAYKIEINENKTIGVRRADIILKDGVEVARSYHRHLIAPGDNVTAETQQVQDLANSMWTDEVIAAYEKSISQ